MRIHAYGNKYHDSDDSNKEEEPLLFFCKALTCEYPMKNQYYAYGPNPTKDKRVPTKEIFCSYYSERSLAKDSDFERKCARGGRNYIPIFKDCLNYGFPVIFRKDEKNMLQANEDKRGKNYQHKTKAKIKRGKYR